LDVLWAAIRSSWTEEKRHQAFLAHCQERDALPEAARRYRALGSDPNATDEEKRVADQKLRSITALALSKLANEKASPAGAGMKYIRLAAALILAAALLLLGWALAR
jgi:ABC-type branched-subunit amino acid transport system ATPase component